MVVVRGHEMPPGDARRTTRPYRKPWCGVIYFFTAYIIGWSSKKKARC